MSIALRLYSWFISGKKDPSWALEGLPEPCRDRAWVASAVATSPTGYVLC